VGTAVDYRYGVLGYDLGEIWANGLAAAGAFGQVQQPEMPTSGSEEAAHKVDSNVIHARLNDPPLPESVDEIEDDTTTMKDSPVAVAPALESGHLLQTGDEITGVPNVNDVAFRRLNGRPEKVDITDNKVKFSDWYTSVGAPAALATNGVLYWELGIEETSGVSNAGFELGIEETSGMIRV